MNDTIAVIVGSSDDPHVAAVLRSVGERAEVILLDASTLKDGGWRWTHGLEVRSGGCWKRPARGWLRRLAPAGWNHGVTVDSPEAVEAHACLQLLSAAADAGSSCAWLTDYWSLMRAENKLVQNQDAGRGSDSDLPGGNVRRRP